MKILNVVGARPNFVKIAPIIHAMRQSAGIEPLLVHTGQHYDREMSDSFFRDLDIPEPTHHLHVQPGSAASQVSEVISRLEPVMVEERPDAVLVVGDVNSTLAGALTAVKLRVPVVHVEAGLRSFDRRMPEEINRIVTDAVSDLLFVSEPSGVENLLREGRPQERIFLVGNVMIDTLRRTLKRPEGSFPMSQRPAPRQGRYAVLTLHRQGLVDDLALFGRVWSVLQEVAQQIPLIFPVHPRTQQRLREMGFVSAPANGQAEESQGIQMVPPLGYVEFLHLQKDAALVLTDSGGIQEETTALGVPCLTLRENTERPFTVTEGTNKIVGLDPGRIRREACQVLAGNSKRGRVPALWDGNAAERIVRVLCEHFQEGAEREPQPREFVMPTSVSALGIE